MVRKEAVEGTEVWREGGREERKSIMERKHWRRGREMMEREVQWSWAREMKSEGK